MRVESSAAYQFEVGAYAHDRFVTVEGVSYDDLDSVMRAHPAINPVECLTLYCEGWLRQHHGNVYRLIRNADDFKFRYRNRPPHAVTPSGHDADDYGVYDVGEVDEPRLQGDMLRCYVEETQYGVPYRVEMPWPYDVDAYVDFALLRRDYGADDDYI